MYDPSSVSISWSCWCFFRRFTKNFSVSAKHLYDSFENLEFSFDANEYKATNILKKRLETQPVSSIYFPSLEIQYDASLSGFEAILMQKQKDGQFRPAFFYFSRRTYTESKVAYNSFELEYLTLAFVGKRFYVYLFGILFRIIIDRDSFRLTLSKERLWIPVYLSK